MSKKLHALHLVHSLVHPSQVLICLHAACATGWDGITSLKNLSVAYNPMAGAIPDTSVGTAMAYLNIAGTGLTGSLPGAWNSLSALQCLLVHNSPGLCGAVPSALPCLHTEGTSLGE